MSRHVQHAEVLVNLANNNNVAVYDLAEGESLRERFTTTQPMGKTHWGPARVMVTRHAEGVTVAVTPVDPADEAAQAAFDLALNVELVARGPVEDTLERSGRVRSAVEAAGGEVWATGYGFGVRDLSVDCPPDKLAAVVVAVLALEDDALVSVRRKGEG